MLDAGGGLTRADKETLPLHTGNIDRYRPAARDNARYITPLRYFSPLIIHLNVHHSENIIFVREFCEVEQETMTSWELAAAVNSWEKKILLNLPWRRDF